MRVLLLGATGRTGKLVLDCLLKENHTVHVLVRNPSKVAADSPRLKIFEGDTTDHETVTKASCGCEAVISVLNISRNSDFPWSKLRTAETFMSDTMWNVIQVCREKNINRIIVCSAWGVHETKKDIPAWFRWFINNSNIGAAYRDHERQEDLITGSGLDYTIVRPVGLTNSKEKPVDVTLNNIPSPKLTVSRASTAAFISQVLKTGAFSRTAVTVWNR